MKSVIDFINELEMAVSGLPINYSTRATEIVVVAEGDVIPVSHIETGVDVRDGKTRVFIVVDPKEAR